MEHAYMDPGVARLPIQREAYVAVDIVLKGG
jgi:hypothetical protein